MTKKGHQKVSALKYKFFSKKRSFENLFGEKFFRPPKLGARSPPMNTLQWSQYSRFTRHFLLPYISTSLYFSLVCYVFLIDSFHPLILPSIFSSFALNNLRKPYLGGCGQLKSSVCFELEGLSLASRLTVVGTVAHIWCIRLSKLILWKY